MTSVKKVAVLPGDGIGPEVVDAVLPVLDLLQVPVELTYGDIGWEYWRREGDPVPERTWELLDTVDTCLLAAITSKPPREAEAELAGSLQGQGIRYVSPVIQLRQRFGLFANVRPVENLQGHGRPYRFALIRENTEGMYAGFDYTGDVVPAALRSMVGGHANVVANAGQDLGVSLRLVTRLGLDRLLRFSFAYARAHGHSLLTWVDKPNVLRSSSALAREVLEEVTAEYPGIAVEVQNANAVAMWMVEQPERFGVVVAENMFGDVLSGLGEGVVGGLGLAPSGNYGQHGSYFEPVHGSAPHLAGADCANPSAMLLAVGMMLEHLGFSDAALEIPKAVRSVLARGESLTFDLGGGAGTRQSADALLAACGPGSAQQPTAAVLTVGDELLSGAVEDTNTTQAARLLTGHGFRVRATATTGDPLADITRTVRGLLGHDLLVVIGGLGPTSDDRTREGVAQALGVPLEHHAEAWTAVQHRLKRFGLAVHQDNERQAFFPAGSEPLPNANGTAWGSSTTADGTRVVMLPGPPRECMPMLQEILDRIAPASKPADHPHWRTLGLIEADVAALIDQAVQAEGLTLTPSYLWAYPYVDIALPVAVGEHPDLEALIDRILAGHVVSRRRLTAAEELRMHPGKPVISLDDRLTDGLAAERLASAADAGIAVRAWSDEPLTVTDGQVWDGTVTMHCEVRINDLTRTYALTAPKRGPEVVDMATDFVAWSVLRACAGEGDAHADR
ncbi:isocitrate/isopropylmalate family dehydrogenase [Streptomyces sp. NBC_01077]|uniref:isocitrate/isopropylmalate family dehydrogenase n=1 Tax=Streptomyces sp. NBC_01077 TaxID=2903746 RepID=UPI003868ABD2|nr:isocitrate/isopropylmalate family dehydrogenase [Streptomyces sp. NBC_01077]